MNNIYYDIGYEDAMNEIQNFSGHDDINSTFTTALINGRKGGANNLYAKQHALSQGNAVLERAAKDGSWGARRRAEAAIKHRLHNLKRAEKTGFKRHNKFMKLSKIANRISTKLGKVTAFSDSAYDIGYADALNEIYNS